MDYLSKKIMKLAVICFILAFYIDFFLIEFFYKETYINNNDIKYYGEIKDNVIYEGIDLEKISQMNISGEDLNIIKDFCNTSNIDFIKFLSCYMTAHNYEVDDVGKDLNQKYYEKYENKILEEIYYKVFKDIECFPVAIFSIEDKNRYYYNNSFLAPRTYGGERQHMGIDIMDDENEKGYFPIVSMTDGTIQNIGWLELGGYRVGITTDSGAYFYYAHMDSYAEGIKEGDKVKAGQLLGYMGNTGYGPEGTEDKFQVHLHIGISIPLGKEDEFWINPYPILEMYENNQAYVEDKRSEVIYNN